MTISGNDLTASITPDNTEKDEKHEKKQSTPPQPIPRREQKDAPLVKLRRRDISFQSASIQQGSSAKVYKACYQKQTVAIKKFFKNEACAEEAEMMRQLSSPASPYALQLIGHVDTAPTCCAPADKFLVTEYMAGGDLWYAFERRDNLNWPSRLKIAFDVSNALSYLHHKDLIHGDIKSMNILLDENNDAKLADFGLTHRETKGFITGTSPWLAPELFYDGRTSTKSSDIYSLGILFFELATHSHAIVNAYPDFAIPSLKKTFAYDNRIVEEIDRLEQAGECPPAFASLIKDCIKSPERDRPTIHQIIERLLAILMLQDLCQQPAAHPVEEMRTALTPRNRR